ncbi:unnamed protein product [Prorocentrum cordatum]|uniref:Uncharacterized protein n=1 Tax=Prorocentrum cordatum TaxID=2364126 RepID=A0ABN9XXD1_9DINO|nr:unnamed protein product [Polarella glacialis]
MTLAPKRSPRGSAPAPLPLCTPRGVAPASVRWVGCLCRWEVARGGHLRPVAHVHVLPLVVKLARGILEIGPRHSQGDPPAAVAVLDNDLVGLLGLGLGVVSLRWGCEGVVAELEKGSRFGQCGRDVVLLLRVQLSSLAGGVVSVKTKKCPRFGQRGLVSLVGHGVVGLLL